MSSKQEQQLLRPKFNWVVCLLIVSAALLFMSQFRFYNALREQARAYDQIDAINSQLALIAKTYDYIHELGENRQEDARVSLNMALRAELRVLDSALISTDEETRSFAKHVVAIIDLDKRRHPAYYAVPSVAHSSCAMTNACGSLQDCEAKKSVRDDPDSVKPSASPKE